MPRTWADFRNCFRRHESRPLVLISKSPRSFDQFGCDRQKCGVDICLPREYEEGPPGVLGEHGTRGPGACPRDTGAKGRARVFSTRAQRELSGKTFQVFTRIERCPLRGTASLRTGRPLRPYSQGRLCHAHFVRLAVMVEKVYYISHPVAPRTACARLHFVRSKPDVMVAAHSGA